MEGRRADASRGDCQLGTAGAVLPTGPVSGGDVVLMDKPAEAVNSLYVAHAVEAVLAQMGDRYLEVDPAVRAFAVVVLDELAR
jgi:hypothetical protein